MVNLMQGLKEKEKKKVLLQISKCIKMINGLLPRGFQYILLQYQSIHNSGVKKLKTIFSTIIYKKSATIVVVQVNFLPTLLQCIAIYGCALQLKAKKNKNYFFILHPFKILIVCCCCCFVFFSSFPTRLCLKTLNSQLSPLNSQTLNSHS